MNTEHERTELLPCPFCGETEGLIIQHCEGTIIHPALRIYCDNCGASSGHSDRVDPVENWNRRAALQSQKPEPNDVMLSGVLRMPFEMAMASEISRLQFYQRAQQALNELEALQLQDREDEHCTWHNDPETDNSWDTDCRQLFEIYDGTPSDNGMAFCCYCGKPIRESIDHARRAEGEEK